MKILGQHFKKSTFSPIQVFQPGCVAVSISRSEVLVADTKNPTTVLQFSLEEWDAFIRGVKMPNSTLSK